MSLDLTRPATIAEAVAELADDEAMPLAGGTNIVLLMNTRLLEPRRLISLDRIPGLSSVGRYDGFVEIGAMCTHHQLSTDPTMRDVLPRVAEMFGRIGNIRVRSWATVGGNLAHADPAQDPAVLLGALRARLTAQGPAGERAIDVADLADGIFSTVLEPQEIITSVRIPIPAPEERHAYVKFLPRTADDYATVSAAANLTVEDEVVTSARLVLGSVAPTAAVAVEAAEALLGRRPDDVVALATMAEAVQSAISPFSDVRASASYRRRMAGVITRRAVLACGLAGPDATERY